MYEERRFVLNCYLDSYDASKDSVFCFCVDVSNLYGGVMQLDKLPISIYFLKLDKTENKTKKISFKKKLVYKKTHLLSENFFTPMFLASSKEYKIKITGLFSPLFEIDDLNNCFNFHSFPETPVLALNHSLKKKQENHKASSSIDTIRFIS